MRKLCLKCATVTEVEPYTLTAECPKCGAIYSKLEAAVIAKAEREAIARNAPGSVATRIVASQSAALPAPTSPPRAESPSPVITVQPNFDRQNRGSTVAYIGCALMAIGVFLPIITMPIVGSINYFANGKGDGTIILVLAVIASWLVFTRKFMASAICGGVAVAAIAFAGVRIAYAINSMQDTVTKDLKGNPFAGLATAFASSVQISWGWIVLIAGSALLIAGSLYARRRSRARNETSLRQEPRLNTTQGRFVR